MEAELGHEDNQDVSWKPRARHVGPDLQHIHHLLSQQNRDVVPERGPAQLRRAERPLPREHRRRFSARKKRPGLIHEVQRKLSQTKCKGLQRMPAPSPPTSSSRRGQAQGMAEADDTGVEDWLIDLRDAALKVTIDIFPWLTELPIKAVACTKAILSFFRYELVHHAGVGNGEYRRLSERVSIDRLIDAWGMLSEWRVPRRFFLQHSVNLFKTGHLALGVDMVMMAALSRALASRVLQPHTLRLEVLDARDEAQFCNSDFALIISGLILIVKSLPLSGSVQRLTVILPQQATAQQCQRLQPVKVALLESLQRVSCLRLSIANIQAVWGVQFMKNDGAIPCRSTDWLCRVDRNFERVFDFQEEVQHARKKTENTVKALLLKAADPRSQKRCKSLANVPRDLWLEIFRRTFGA